MYAGLTRPSFLFNRRRHLLLHRSRSLPGAMFGHFLDARRNTGVAPHQRMQIVRVEPQQTGASDRCDRCGATRPPQQSDLSEKLAGAEADTFFLSFNLDLDLTGGESH